MTGSVREPAVAKARRPTLAERADRHDLYQRAVQAPAEDVAFFTRLYRSHRRRLPLRLREDFCGTAHLAATWARSHPRRTALAVDLDTRTLAWGRAHNLDPGGPALSRRVRLVCANVLDVARPRVDLTCAMNFSFCVFKERGELRRYLEVAHSGLERDGIFVAELYGGTEAVVAMSERRRVGSATYVWEQESYNPINHETRCAIHFRFRDGSRLDRAFRYDWRLWTVPELRELLAETGFAASEVWWDRVDGRGRDTATYVRTEEEENQESWLVYVVGVK